MILLTKHEVKDLEGQKILDNIALALNYQETINGEPNPKTKQEFYQEWVLEKTLEIVGQQISATASRIAVQNKTTEINNLKPELTRKKDR